MRWRSPGASGERAPVLSAVQIRKKPFEGDFSMFLFVNLPNLARGTRWLSVSLILFKLGTANAVPSTDCPGPYTGISLSPGFCASIFADNVGHARHLVVSPSGVVYVNTWSGVYYNSDPIPPGGFLVALKDTLNTGNADLVKRFGESKADGAAGGTGIALFGGAIYAEVNDRIMRYALAGNEIVPSGKGQVIVSGLPITGDHPMHPFIIDAIGNLFVDVGTATNACEEKNRVPNSPGRQPCMEKETRGGTWRYDANKTSQRFSAADRYASGIRNGEGFATDAEGRLFVTQHGRDQLGEDWPQFYKGQSGPNLPAEEIVQLEQGHDYGWPECYFDGVQKKLVLGPEYGGDGGKKVGVCATRTPPVAFFPAHWAPNDLLFASDPALPAVYRDGAFVAFHGSWNRAPAPQGGYNVVFQPMKNGKAAGEFIIFADGFAGAIKEPGRAAFRPTGLAQGPDGVIYISDDLRGRIWRVTYRGGPYAVLASAPASQVQAGSSSGALPPEGVPPNVWRNGVASLPTPPGATQAEVALGSRIFHGQVRNGTCAGCHGSDGKGSPVGADLTAGTWLWSDGSLEGLTKTISAGVATPKGHLGAMPPMGGSPLSAADLKAVSVYAWAIGHQH
jgi:glucose/arabinose dehydrogenase/mono/diheme cytochrome c family protein